MHISVDMGPTNQVQSQWGLKNKVKREYKIGRNEKVEMHLSGHRSKSGDEYNKNILYTCIKLPKN